MEPIQAARAFGATIAQIYERDLVPLLFEPYASMMAERVGRVMRSRAASANVAAAALCQGTPLRAELEAYAGADLTAMTQRVADALERRFGSGAVEGMMQARLVSVCTSRSAGS